MATGGTIPNNRSQSVTFYDTTGIIERHKNIYYAPVFEEAGDTDIRNAYLSRFNEVCPPSSAYTDIDISSWSPQDRTLVVRGNIDDFRLVTDEGACLNYFIITRRITKGESVETYYYGFFITGVSQAGGSSITITAEPDDFTNVFYLHNRDSLTVGYDPFNKKMSNCYVNRQHYDRVKVTSWAYRLSIINMNLTPNFINIGDSISIYEDEGGRLLLSGIVKDYLIDDLQPRNMQITITVESQPSVIEDNIPIGIHVADNAPFYGDVSSGSIERTIEPDNGKVFLNQEETYKFKYQYRKSKLPFSFVTGIFSESELALIKSASSIDDLSVSLRTKVIKACLSYVVIETKSLEIVANYSYGTFTGPNKGYISGGTLVGKATNMPNVLLVYPTFQPHSLFEHLFDESTIRITITCNSESSEVFLYNIRNNYRVSSANGILNSGKLGPYFLSAYMIKELPIDSSLITVTKHEVLQEYYIDFMLKLPEGLSPTNTTSFSLNKGVYLGGVAIDPSDEENKPQIEWSSNGWGASNASPCMLISGLNNIDLSFSLRFSIPSLFQLPNVYYDPVLETEPYTFYSISNLSSYELCFNKNRFYDNSVDKINFTINLSYYISTNNGLKQMIIPKYKVEGYETKYFNEGLSYITDSSLPILSDSYTAYYYQNKAQMKNQFAVAEKSMLYDIQQHFFLSGPNAVGVTATHRGGWGAIAETGNQQVEMANELIDYKQNKDIIEMNQKAVLADVGNKPDSLKQAGSDFVIGVITDEAYFYINNYRIDNLSYNSIARYLERYGYQVNLYDELHTYDRVGWNFIKLNGFDWKPEVNIMVSQEESIKTIFNNGVTLLHDKNFLTSGHNYERILKE